MEATGPRRLKSRLEEQKVRSGKARWPVDSREVITQNFTATINSVAAEGRMAIRERRPTQNDCCVRMRFVNNVGEAWLVNNEEVIVGFDCGGDDAGCGDTVQLPSFADRRSVFVVDLPRQFAASAPSSAVDPGE